MRQTPLHDEHVANGGKVVDFHGWALPVQFAGIVQEHLHTRQKASLFDCSHMGEFLICGEDNLRAFGRLVYSDILGLGVGRARYGGMLNDSGGIIDDVISFRLAEDELYVVTNAGPLARVSKMIREAVPDACDLSAETAKIDIQGPLSRAMLVRGGLTAAAELKYFGLCQTDWRGREVILSRTGYTGELGFELFVPGDLAVPLWRMLLEFEAVAPAGLGARDTLRTEMGYSLSGQDVDESHTPLESGMERFVAWDTEFVGKEALCAQRERGGYPVLTAIKTLGRRAPRKGFDVYAHAESIDADADRVGTVTSGTFGPTVGHGIGLAYLPQELRRPGTALTAGPKRIAVETAEIPFYSGGTCRA
jgi:aminomethyltransferase